MLFFHCAKFQASSPEEYIVRRQLIDSSSSTHSQLQQQLDSALAMVDQANTAKSNTIKRAASAEQRAAAAEAAVAASDKDTTAELRNLRQELVATQREVGSKLLDRLLVRALLLCLI